MKKRKLSVPLMFALLTVTGTMAVSTGSVRIHLFDMGEVERNILLNVRMPRVLLAGLVGASLALSGTLFQYVMKNPLADSFTTGVSASSAMGAVLAIVLGLVPFIPIFALVGGILGILLVYRIASIRGRVQPVTMLLAGIVLSTFASAVISLVKYMNEESLGSIIFWLMGGFQAATPSKDISLFAIIILSFYLVRGDYLRLDILCFDDTTASSSGVDVHKMRRKLFFIAALLTSFSVGYAGIIGFVGLIVPHLMRLANLIRAEELIPAALLGGATFMILTDLIARSLLPEGQELPVGIITSSLGGLFFWLLIRRRREIFYFD